jgi:hypothetical protein
MFAVMLDAGACAIFAILLVASTAAWQSRKKALGIALGGLCVLLWVAIAAPGWKPATGTAKRNACKANVHQLQMALEAYQTERVLAVETNFSLDLLKPRLKNGLVPVCPSGGTYELQASATRVRCSVKDHNQAD